MARLVGSYSEAINETTVREVAGTTVNGMRPGRCVGKCGVGIARPNGGATNSQMRCPLCGGAVIQSTWGSKAVRKGYVVLSKAESLALARGEKIEVERPLTPGIVNRMDIHAIYERISVAPERELAMLNAEVQRRLG